MKHSVRLAIAFFVLSTLPVAFVSYVSIVNAERTILRELENHLTSITEMRAADFGRWAQSLEHLAESIAQRPFVVDLTTNLVAQARGEAGEDPTVAAALLGSHLIPHLRTEGLFEAFSIVDAQSGEVLISTEPEQVGKYRNGEPYFEGGRDRTYVGRVRFTPALEALTMHLGVPIGHGSGPATAVLAGRVDLAMLNEIVSFAADKHKTEDVYLVNAYGFFVTEPRFGENYALRRFTRSEAVNRALEGTSGVAQYEDCRGVPVLGAFRWLPDHEMALVAEIDRSEAFAAIADARILGLALMGGAIVVFTSLGIGLARRMTYPLRRIAAGARKIGKGEFSHRIRSKRADEYGDLARTFDRMAENLEAITASRDDLQREMDSRREAEAQLRKTLSALRDSERKFRLLSEASPIAVCIWRDDCFEYVNPAMEKMFGYPASQLVGHLHPVGLTHPDDRDDVRRYMDERSRQPGVKPPLRFRGVRKDGIVISCEGLARPIDYKGKAALLGTITDTTLRTQAEERFRLAAQVASDLIYEWDIETDKLRWYGDVDAALGYEPGEVPQTIEGWVRLIHPDDRDRLTGSVERHRTETEPIFEQYRVRCKDGSWRHWIDRGVPILLGRGRPRRWVGVCIDDTERLRAYRAVSESEEKHRLLFEHAGVGIGYYTPEGVLLGYNQLASEHMGGLSGDFVGKSIEDMFGEDRGVEYQRRVNEAAQTLKTSTYEDRVELPTGAKWFLSTYSPVQGSEGELAGVQVVSKEITERKVTEEALRESETKFRELVEEIREVIYAVDASGAVTYVSPSSERLIGYRPEEVTGRPYASFGFSGDLPGIEEMKRLFAQKTDLQPGDYRLLAKDGTIRWVRTASHPIMDKGRFAGFRGVLVDITEAKQAEEALRISEQRYRSLFENAALGIYRTTPDGRILAANPALIRMLGYHSFEELAARNLEHDGYEPETPRERFKDRLDRDGHVDGLEAVWVRKDGTRLFVRENAVAVRDLDGAVLFYEGTVEDITAQREAEAHQQSLEMQLRQTQRLESIGTLASGVAHEINNPLTGMINYGELIGRRVEDPRLKEFAEAIMSEGARVAKIVRNLLSFSRQEKEAHSPARLADIVAATMTLIGRSLEKDRIALEIDVPEDLPRIKCRSQQLQQVLLNLLTNARDALNDRFPGEHPDKRICVTARRMTRDDGAWIRVVVEDRGAGIPPDHLDRVFDPFFTTKPRDRGTGLGLSVSYGIVRDHGGRLSAESTEGSFTRFFLDLPVDNGWRLAEDEA